MSIVVSCCVASSCFFTVISCCVLFNTGSVGDSQLSLDCVYWGAHVLCTLKVCVMILMVIIIVSCVCILITGWMRDWPVL